MHPVLAVLLGTVLSFAPLSSAESITFTESAIATGSLGSNSFDDSLVTLTATGDTSNVVLGGAFGTTLEIQGLAVSIDIAGVGTAELTDPGFVFSAPGRPAAGIGDQVCQPTSVPACFYTILDTIDSAFGTYNMTTSVGPITDSSDYTSGLDFSTSDGEFVIDSAGDATFTATASSPEPSTTTLFGFGLAGLALVAKSRMRAGRCTGIRS
jgi:hypothetical protein